MKIFLALACALMCFFAVPKSTQGQNLKGMHGVGIVIDYLGPIEKNLGLTSESLSDEILVALKRDLPKLKVELSGTSSYVYLTLASVEARNPVATFGVATSVTVSLRRPVEIIGDDGRRYFTFATAWARTGIVIDSIPDVASDVRDQISKFVTALAAQYYKDNP